MRLLLNPPGSEGEYLSGLRRCFPGWGGPAEFRWWFQREVGARSADLLVVHAGDEPVAGIALSYRKITLAPGGAELGAIVTGAWTLPEHRKRGCFSALIERACERAGECGARLVLGFSGAERASIGTLARHASEQFKAWQILGTDASPRPVGGAARPGDRDLYRWFGAGRVSARIEYETLELFRKQARVTSTEFGVRGAGEGLWGIVSTAGGRSRTQALVAEGGAPELDRAGWALSRLPASYTVDPELAGAARRAGARTQDAFLFAFLTGTGAPLAVPRKWSLENIDRA